MLDPRIAHGMAKKSVDSKLPPKGLVESIYKKLYPNNTSNATIKTKKGARRKILEIQKIIAPTVMHMKTGETNSAGPYIEWIGLDSLKGKNFDASLKNHVSVCKFTYYPFSSTGVINAVVFAGFSLHAIARHYQRGGDASWQHTIEEIRKAIPSIWLIHGYKKLVDKSQIFAPVPDGIFVGTIDEVEVQGKSWPVPMFKTFIGKSTISPKWEECKTELNSVISSDDHDWEHFANLLLLNIDPEKDLRVQKFKESIETKKFRWLLDAYERREDKQIEVWNSRYND